MLAGLKVRFDLTPPTQEQMRELVADLSVEERRLLLEHGEEASFCGVFLHEERGAVYLPLVRTAFVQSRRKV
jgi:peptide-methionine (R)-S-oxide reductase